MQSDAEYAAFVKYCTDFFVADSRLWRKDPQGAHKVVVDRGRQIAVMAVCHDEIGHKGLFATRTTVFERFWWPHMLSDIAWFVRTCHLCQQRQTRQVLIPPVVATPAPIFAKVYIDTLHLPMSQKFKYIVQARCSLTQYPEFRMLRTENAESIGNFVFQDLLCRWGGLSEIVTDNGPAFVKAVEYLAKRYTVNHVRISSYNSRANGLVERMHFVVRQSLFKVANGDASRWSQATHSVFWAERITVRKRMGCSPYFAITGCHPVIPLDVVEATYLQPPPTSILSTTDLIARRAIALQKRPEQVAKLHSRVFAARKEAAICFERIHSRTIKDHGFKKGDLVLMRNTAIEKSLNRKMRPRYLGPLVVVLRNRGGAYVLCELDGSVLHRPIAAFRLIPYLARKTLKIPAELLDVDAHRLRELQETSDVDGDEDELPHLNSDVEDENPE